MTNFKRRLVLTPAIAGLFVAIACAASAQQPDRPGFLDSLFGGSDRVSPQAQPAQGEIPAEGRQARSNDLMVRLERLEGQIRQLTGAIEELQHRNQQLEAQFSDLRGGPPRASAAPVYQPPRPAVAPSMAPVPAAPTGRRGDAFDPGQNPAAPGAPRVLGSPASASVPPQASEPEKSAALEAPAGSGAGAPLDISTLSGAAVRDPTLAPSSTVASGEGSAPARTLGGTGTRVATLPPTDSPKDNFDLAYGYVLRKDYALAEDGFRSFLVKFPHDRLVPEAYYWLGESLFQSQQYRDAAESFLTVSTKFETTGKAPDAMLRLGQALAALGEKEAACASLGEVMRKYPRASVGVKQGVDREQKRVHC